MMTRRTTAIFVLLHAVTATSATAQDPAAPPFVSSQAQIDVLLPPGRAAVMIALAGEGADAQAAATAADSARARLLPVLRNHRLELVPWGAGYGENLAVRRMIPGQMDVRTSRDYLVRQGFIIHVPDVSRVITVMRDLTAAGVGGSVTVLYYPNEADPKLAEAYAEATKIATQRAEAIARAAGGTLGPLISITTSPGFPQQAMARIQSFADGSGVPIAPSDVLVRIAVNGSWRFQPR